MKRKLYFSFIAFFLVISLLGTASDKVKTVVIFFPLDANLPAYQSFLKGLNSRLSSSIDQPYNIIYEYMSNYKSQGENYEQNLVELYNEKYKTVDIDLIVTFGPGSYSILKKNNFLPLSNTPIINVDLESLIEQVKGDSIQSNNRVLHIPIILDYEKTVRAATELFPENKDIYILSGSAGSDNYYRGLTVKAAKSINEFNNIYELSDITLDSTLTIVKSIPVNSIVFVASYIEDHNNIPYTTAVVLRIISKYCKAPIFTLSDSFIDTGALGGFIFSFEDVGKRVEEIINLVLSGTSISELSSSKDDFTKHLYDWQVLRAWNLLDSEAIPLDSEFVNKEENFVLEYKWYLIGIALFLIGQTLLIMFLFNLNKRHKAVARQRDENENLFREIVREDRLSRMSELTASLSHELNQPITAILYSAQAGKRFLETGKLSDQQAKEIFDNIIEDDKRAGNLISSVRSLMKLEVREKEKIDLNKLINETETLFKSESIQNHININANLKDQPVFVYGDKIQLQQVMLNLLFNAENSMEDNVDGNRNIQIDLEQDDKDVSVSISDTGTGISDSIRDSLFKPFETSREKGFGIGLAVSRSIIEAHQGVIKAENISSGGARFTFVLKIYHG